MLFIGAFLKKRGRLQSLRVITISVNRILFQTLRYRSRVNLEPFFSRRFLGMSLKRRACLSGPECRVVEETWKITDVPSDWEKQKFTTSSSGEPHEFIL